MWVRVLLAAAALGAGALAGRRAINKAIENRLPAEIETARELAMIELDKTINVVLRERLFAFSLGLVTKAGLIGAAYLLYSYGFLTAVGLKVVIPFLIAVFVFRDLFNILPFAAPALKIVRRHKWNARKAIVEFVAGVAFERAYAETMVTMESGPGRHWVALSRYSKHNLSTQVAEAVADVARSTSFDRAKGRIFLSAIFAAIIFSVYVSFFIFTVGSV
ncbi:MAG: hypothetical protein AAGD92_06630 [Pseudomonadota bacterium]